MQFNFDNNIPIYIQLVDQIQTYILSGTLAAGERLPSVRELSMLSHANPNTVQKALAELEEMELIRTERTNGKFVTENSAHIEALRRASAEAVAKRFLADMEKIGYTENEALDCLKQMKGENQ